MDVGFNNIVHDARQFFQGIPLPLGDSSAQKKENLAVNSIVGEGTISGGGCASSKPTQLANGDVLDRQMIRSSQGPMPGPLRPAAAAPPPQSKSLGKSPLSPTTKTGPFMAA